MESQTTLQQAILYFSQFENCRWPDGTVKVPASRCGEGYLARQNAHLEVRQAGTSDLTFKTGTIFELPDSAGGVASRQVVGHQLQEQN